MTRDADFCYHHCDHTGTGIDHALECDIIAALTDYPQNGVADMVTLFDFADWTDDDLLEYVRSIMADFAETIFGFGLSEIHDYGLSAMPALNRVFVEIDKRRAK